MSITIIAIAGGICGLLIGGVLWAIEYAALRRGPAIASFVFVTCAWVIVLATLAGLQAYCAQWRLSLPNYAVRTGDEIPASYFPVLLTSWCISLVSLVIGNWQLISPSFRSPLFAAGITASLVVAHIVVMVVSMFAVAVLAYIFAGGPE